jgi:diguanylate cyclase
MQVSDIFHANNFIQYFSQVIFLLMIGGLDGIIVSRGRKHHSEKNLLAEVVNRDYLTNS